MIFNTKHQKNIELIDFRASLRIHILKLKTVTFFVLIVTIMLEKTNLVRVDQQKSNYLLMKQVVKMESGDEDD